MLKHLKTFFNPSSKNYSYTQPKELIISKIKEVFKEKVTLLSSNDMKGIFLSKDTFEIEIISAGYANGVKYSSSLIGEIIETQNGRTQIKTIAKPSVALYILFLIGIVFGIIAFYNFMQTNSFVSLFWSIVIIIGLPTFSIGFSNVAIAAIRERYKMYIDKELKS